MSSTSLRPSGVLSAPLALVLSLALTLTLGGSAALVAQLLPQRGPLMFVLALLELLLYGSAALLVARVFGGGGKVRALALERPTALQLVLGASLGVVLHLPAGYLDALVERRFPTPRERMLEQLAQLTPQSNLHAVLLLLGVALLAPLAEELFFRGALFTSLARTAPTVVATWTTSLAFVLAHQEVRMWAPLLLVALVLSELRRESGSIWPAFALHAAFNATTLASVFATRPTELQPPDVSWTLGLGGGLLSVAGIWVFARVSRRRGAPAVLS